MHGATIKTILLVLLSAWFVVLTLNLISFA